MTSNLNNDPVLESVSQTLNEKVDDAEGSEKRKVVLPGECGETLWDEVLNQDKKIYQQKKAKKMNAGLIR